MSNHESKVVLFMGGNGHSKARIAPVQAAARAHGFSIVDLEYPGFEDRDCAPSFEAFQDALEEQAKRYDPEQTLIYATGIGGLIFLALRGRGRLLEYPAVLQGAVLWGLEKRWFPKLLGKGPMPHLVKFMLARKAMQRRFARKHFQRSLSDEEIAGFFEGYKRCPAFSDFFKWMRPALLRKLELQFKESPEALDRISVWWGLLDHVVTKEELLLTEKALGHRFPTREFPTWSHYPMIDAPQSWVEELHDYLAQS